MRPILGLCWKPVATLLMGGDGPTREVLAMWFVFVTLLAVWTAWSMYRWGRRFAVGSTVLLALLVPTWVKLEIGPIPIDVKVAATGIALLAYVFHPRTRWSIVLIAADFAIGAMFVTHVFSDSLNSGLQWSTPIRAYGEWILAYVAGRFAIHEPADLKRLMPLGCGVCIALGIWGLVEGLAQVNPADYLVGQRPGVGPLIYTIRMGLKRADGPTQHPIYFGLVQTLLLPWALAAAAAAWEQHRQRWRLAGPPAALIGIASSVSRGPLLAVAMLGYVMTLVRVPRARVPLAVGGLLAIVLVVAQFDRVLGLLHAWSGESGQTHAKVDVGGERVEYTGTTHRLLIWKVYGPAMHRAGWFGFGTDRTTSFPIRVPLGEVKLQSFYAMKYVDNVYVLLDLRFGIVGVTCFVLFFGTCAYYFLRLGTAPSIATGWFCAAMGGAIVATLAALFTVWMPHDIGFVLLWSSGIGTGLWVGRNHDGASIPEVATRKR